MPFLQALPPLPTVLYSGALAFNQIFHLDQLFGITSYQSIAILCVAIGVIGSIYAIFGGLKAVAVSDTVNGVGLLIGGLLIPILSICILGNGSFLAGIQDFITNVPAEKFNAVNPANALPPMIPWPVLFLGMLFNNLFYWCTNQSIIQRTFGAKNLKEAQKGSLLTGLTCVFCPIFLVAPGVIQFIRDGGVLTDFDMAYPSLIKDILPTPVLGFFAAVMFGAILSSFNSVLNSASTMFTLDLYRSSINPQASDTKCVKVGKIYGTCAGTVAICVAPFVMFAQGITTFLNSMSQFVSLPILFTVLGALIFRKAPKYAPKVITAVHVIAYGAFMIIKPCYPTSGEPIHYLYAIAVLFVVEFAIMWYLNKYRGTEEYVPADVGAVDLTPWKYRHIVCIIGIILAIGIYILFSPIGIAA